MTLDELRKQIDEVDAELAALFAQRMALAGRVAEVKRGGIAVLDSVREEMVRRQFLAQVPPELEKYAQTLLETLLAVSRDYQYEVLG